MHQFISAITLLVIFSLASCQDSSGIILHKVKKLNTEIKLDGVADGAWDQAEWLPINHRWLGEPFTEEDFKGRYKFLWNEDHFYLLAETTDDKLIDIHENPREKYWDDDCLEIFIDENRSGGNHQYNHTAFAYHVNLRGHAVDISEKGIARFYDHVKCYRKTNGNLTTWEAKIEIYDAYYQDDGRYDPIKLTEGKRMGFALAYCDNDNSEERENFIGSVPLPKGSENRAWIDASLFGEVMLVD